MPITPDELDLMFKASELAELAGLDNNRDPATYNHFCHAAQEALEEARRRGREDAERERECYG
jgi:hypothetical protein